MSSIIKKIRNYFLPHPENNHLPHFFSTKSVATILTILIVIEFAFLAQIFIVFKKTGFLAAVLPGVLISLTNEVRAQNNDSSLQTNTLLTEAANRKAQDMATKEYFSHVTPDGKTPWYWLDLVGYKYSYAGENLAVNFTDSQETMNAWMQSPTHRENIIKKEYTQTGIGIAQGKYEGKDATFVVQFFATLPEKIPTIIQQNQTEQTIVQDNVPAPTVDARVLGSEIEISTAVENTNKIAYVATIPKLIENHITTNALILIFLVIFIAILVKIRVQHPHIFSRGLILIVAVLILIIFNNGIIPSVKISNDSQSASVINVIP